MSDLKTKSFRLGLTSESEDSDRDSRVRARDRGRDSDSSSSSMRSRRGTGREAFSSSNRRRDDVFPSQNRRGLSNSMGSVSRRRFDSNSEVEEADHFSPRGGRQFGSQDGFSQLAKRGGRDSGLSSRSREGGGKPHRGGRESGRQALRFSDIDDEEEEEDKDDDEEDMSGFEDSEEDADIDVFERASPSPDSAEEINSQPIQKPSAEGSASYLSQTRYYFYYFCY